MKKLSLEEVQKSELEILKYVAELCDKLGLRYYLTFGTLIGAARHKGFIPWDDDLDIMMPRCDYAKLIAYFEKNQMDTYPFKAVYVWHDYKYSYAMARITDMRYKLSYQKTFWYSNEDMGTFIDIYPMDGMGNDKSLALDLSKDTLPLIRWISWANSKAHYKRDSFVKDLITVIGERIAKFKGEDYFQQKLKKKCKSFNYDESEYVGFLTWHTKIYYLLRSDIDGDAFLDFSGCRFRVPQKYDSFLRKLYGDYMVLPPESERHETHFYDAYIR